MIITIELLLKTDDASAIQAALDAIVHRISDVGYTDGDFENARNDAGKLIPYRIIQGTNTGR